VASNDRSRPSNLQEAVDFTYRAFDLAERDRNPVLLLADGYITTMMEAVELPEFREVDYNSRPWAVRGKGEGPGRAVSSGSLAPESVEQEDINMAKMYDTWAQNDVLVEQYRTGDAELIIAAFGTAARIARESVDEMREEGYKVGMIRPITVNPFPYGAFEQLDVSKVKCILDVEMAIPAQMVYDVRLGANGKIPVSTYCRSGGMLVQNDEMIARAKKLYERT